MKQFVSECEPDSAGTLILSGKAYTYLIKVRRMRTGDVLSVLLPESGSADMVIDLIDGVKKQLQLKALPAAAKNIRDGGATEIILLQWVLKGTKTDTVVRQATETGVRTVIPVIGEYSIARKQNPAQLERYRRIIKEARQQSGSPVDTVITEPVPPADALTTLSQLIPPETAARILCSETPANGSGSLRALFATKPTHIVLAIGAEGGISSAETELLRAAGFQTIHFKTNVLRAETAALYAIAAVQTIINEAEQWQLPV